MIILYRSLDNLACQAGPPSGVSAVFWPCTKSDKRLARDTGLTAPTLRFIINGGVKIKGGGGLQGF